MMEFLKLSDLKLNDAGYLVNAKTDKPVNHKQFVDEQRAAEYVVKLAEAIKNKNFTCGKVDDLEAIKAEVLASIKADKKIYVDEPAKPVSQVNEELIKFALDFDNYETAKVETQKINDLMNQFNKINDVETVGDYFEEGVVKLAKLYDTQTILAAVKINASKLK